MLQSKQEKKEKILSQLAWSGGKDCISNTVLEGIDLWKHRLLCARQTLPDHLFEIPGENYISLLCQMKQDLFRFHLLETGMVIASHLRNQSNHNKLKARF